MSNVKKEIKISKLNPLIGEVKDTDILPIVSSGKTVFTTIKELLRSAFKIDDTKIDSTVGWSSNKLNSMIVGTSGETLERPLTPFIGQYYWDTTLLKPIWFNGTNWTDGSGTVV